MTVPEFKAFLEGMDVQGTPTSEQWEKIKRKIQLLNPFDYPDPHPYTYPNRLNSYVTNLRDTPNVEEIPEYNFSSLR